MGDRELILSAFLEERARKHRRHVTFGTSAVARMIGKRKARELRQAYIKQLFTTDSMKRRILSRPGALLFAARPHRLRDAMCPDFISKFVPMRRRLRQRARDEVVWTDFSFAKNPEATLDKLVQLISVCGKKADLQLIFADEDCDDVTPYIVLARLREALPPVISGGRITAAVEEVITAVGMRENLRIGTIQRLTKGKDYVVSAFKMRSRTPPGAFGDKDHQLRPQYKEWVADQFVDTLNGWIGEHQLELTDEAAGSFTRAIGEALDNAERHGDALEGVEGDWSIAAFSRLQFDDAGHPLLRCSVGMVSVGATISESLESAAEPIRDHIAKYVNGHTSILRSSAKPEALRTIMALQDGITRDAAAFAGRRGGVGFMELIDVFAEMGENGRENLDSVFTIISGRTCIRVTGPYRQGKKRGSWSRELWFNAANDPASPPSKEHVVTLNHSFPGVILSACFTIDPEHLRNKINDDTSHDQAN